MHAAVIQRGPVDRPEPRVMADKRRPSECSNNISCVNDDVLSAGDRVDSPLSDTLGDMSSGEKCLFCSSCYKSGHATGRALDLRSTGRGFKSYSGQNLPSPVISLPSYALFTGSGSLNASNTSSSHLPTKFTTTQPPYLYNLNSIQRPRSTRSSSVVTLARPPSSSSLKITDRFFRYASPCLWNQLPFLVHLILLPVLPFPTHLYLYPSLLPLLIHHSVHL